jgi:hypothetical protein
MRTYCAGLHLYVRSSIGKVSHMMMVRDLDTVLTGSWSSFLKIAGSCHLFSASLASRIVVRNPWQEADLQIFSELRIRERMLRSSVYGTFRFINNVKLSTGYVSLKHDFAAPDASSVSRGFAERLFYGKTSNTPMSCPSMA